MYIYIYIPRVISASIISGHKAWTIRAAEQCRPQLGDLPPGKVNSLLLKMAIEIVSFPKKNMVIFHSYVKVYQRVMGNCGKMFFPHLLGEGC